MAINTELFMIGAGLVVFTGPMYLKALNSVPAIVMCKANDLEPAGDHAK